MPSGPTALVNRSRDLTRQAAAYIEGDGPEPYRPHLPHPEKAWLWCVTDVVVDATPSNPPDGEQVEEVRVVPLPEARALLRNNQEWYPELLDLAWEIRTATQRA